MANRQPKGFTDAEVTKMVAAGDTRVFVQGHDGKIYAASDLAPSPDHTRANLAIAAGVGAMILAILLAFTTPSNSNFDNAVAGVTEKAKTLALASDEFKAVDSNATTAKKQAEAAVKTADATKASLEGLQGSVNALALKASTPQQQMTSDAICAAVLGCKRPTVTHGNRPASPPAVQPARTASSSAPLPSFPANASTFWGWYHPNSSAQSPMHCYATKQISGKPANCSDVEIVAPNNGETEQQWSFRVAAKQGIDDKSTYKHIGAVK
ncbi:MAG: hypothetical protein JWN37_138 [Candidatus Nomurabacteria bacterium]|nr:hypothetical protein [Candidatus Nomurabacteria bacterium]